MFVVVYVREKYDEMTFFSIVLSNIFRTNPSFLLSWVPKFQKADYGNFHGVLEVIFGVETDFLDVCRMFRYTGGCSKQNSVLFINF